MFESIFARKTLSEAKALSFGFTKANGNYVYETEILDGSFHLKVLIFPSGVVDTFLTETDSGEEYVLYKTTAAGSFVGKVKTQIEKVLTDISDFCYYVDIFKATQTKEIISYVREKYGDELEHLWKTSPDNAIFRRKDTKKWYGAILTITKNKLGFDSDEKVEIIDLHVETQNMDALLSRGNYYPGWHMNKKAGLPLFLTGR